MKQGLWAAGIFIREREIVCVLGEVATQNIPTVGGTHVPTTIRENAPLIEDTPCTNVPPEIAVATCAQKLRQAVIQHKIRLRAVHIAVFGELLSLNEADKNRTQNPVYGVVKSASGNTKKWDGLNIYQIFKEALGQFFFPVEINVGTNVNAAAFGELMYESRKLSGYNFSDYIERTTLVTLNFSRTINIGVIRKGELWTGEKVPMLSAMRPARYIIPNTLGTNWFDLYQGNCPYHRDCLEGLIGTTAIEERTEMAFDDIPDDHAVWEVIAYYIAQACINVVSMLAPSTIVLIGRTTKQIKDPKFADQLVKRVRGYFYTMLCNNEKQYKPSYISPELLKPSELIRLPRRPTRRSQEYYRPGGLPGRHGALRLAAKEVYKLESSNS